MKVIRKEHASISYNGEKCEVLEYDLGSADFSASVAKISGRYPESGYAVNLQCREIAYVLQGSGRIIMAGDKEMELFAGDMAVIESNEKYFWEGNFSALLVCIPAWNQKQYKIINE